MMKIFILGNPYLEENSDSEVDEKQDGENTTLRGAIHQFLRNILNSDS
jgi:hypothetical protein